MISFGDTSIKAAYLGSTRLTDIKLGATSLLSKTFSFDYPELIDFNSTNTYARVYGSSTRYPITRLDENKFSVPVGCSYLELAPNTSAPVTWVYASQAEIGSNDIYNYPIAFASIPGLTASTPREDGCTVQVQPLLPTYKFYPKYSAGHFSFGYNSNSKDEDGTFWNPTTISCYVYRDAVHYCVAEFTKVSVSLDHPGFPVNTWNTSTMSGSATYIGCYATGTTGNDFYGITLPLGWRVFGGHCNYDADGEGSYYTTIKNSGVTQSYLSYTDDPSTITITTNG